jgi:prephenate dehydrogenase
LYHNQTFVLTPLARTTERARRLALAIVEAVGGRALELPAERHDLLTALVSHLPYTAAVALVRAAQAADDEGAGQLASSGFRDTTRLAASDLTMMVDILLTNRAAILEALAGYRRELDGLAQLIEAGDADGLRAALAPAQARPRELFP